MVIFELDKEDIEYAERISDLAEMSIIIDEKLSIRENLADIEEMANKAAAAMVLLQPSVVNSVTEKIEQP